MTTEQTTTRSKKACVHHWQIEAPNGRESRGVCKRCGSKRNFANSTESVMWEQTNTIRSTPSTYEFSRSGDVRMADEAPQPDD